MMLKIEIRIGKLMLAYICCNANHLLRVYEVSVRLTTSGDIVSSLQQRIYIYGSVKTLGLPIDEEVFMSDGMKKPLRHTIVLVHSCSGRENMRSLCKVKANADRTCKSVFCQYDGNLITDIPSGHKSR